MSTHQRDTSGRSAPTARQAGGMGQFARRRWLPLAVALVLAALLLARWHPWSHPAPATPRPVALVPTPTPPAPTRPPDRVALPPATPPTPVATPAASRPATPAAPRGDGTILFVGTLAGQAGIIAAIADGTAQRLLVAGQYDSVAWSPTGDHFAVVGPLLGGLTAQVAIFAPDGRAQGRYAFEGAVNPRLLWSPDGSKLACTVVAANPSQATASVPIETWQIALQGAAQRVTVPDERPVYPLAWTPAGLLAVYSNDGAGLSTLWTVSADGTATTREATGPFVPLALSRDGEILYALERSAQYSRTELVAIALPTGARRTIADADRLAALTFGVPATPNAYAFMVATVSPDAANPAHLAVVIEPVPSPDTPESTLPRSERTIVFLALDGAITGTLRLPDGGWPGPFAWSPDGTLLAFFYTGSTTANQFIVADARGTPRAVVPFYVSGLYGGLTIAWSPESQWLAYASLAGIGVVSLDGLPPYELTPTGGFPTWRP